MTDYAAVRVTQLLESMRKHSDVIACDEQLLEAVGTPDLGAIRTRLTELKVEYTSLSDTQRNEMFTRSLHQHELYHYALVWSDWIEWIHLST